MSREITQRELLDESGKTIRTFVSAESVVAAFAGAPHLELERFRAEIDALLDQDPGGPQL